MVNVWGGVTVGHRGGGVGKGTNKVTWCPNQATHNGMVGEWNGANNGS